LSTIKAINKDNNIHIISVKNTPAKKAEKGNQPLLSSPKSSCPGELPSELPPLI